MTKPIEHLPGEADPAAGTYVLLTVFGTPTPTRVVLPIGASLPNAPRGHTWRLADYARADESGRSMAGG